MTKRQKAIAGLADKTKLYSLEEAVVILKKSPATKFDQTVEISITTGVDQAENPIRGMVTLPHGTGKKVRVAVFAKGGDYEKEAQDAGADFVGGDDLIKKVSEGWCDFDVAVAVPDMMKDMARLGKILGPRGLMPNPKSGTVTKDIAGTVKELKAGKMEFRMDKQSGIKGAVGKLSFDEKAVAENIRAFIRAVVSSSPKLAKMQGIKSIAIASTMGPGVKLELGQFNK